MVGTDGCTWSLSVHFRFFPIHKLESKKCQLNAKKLFSSNLSSDCIYLPAEIAHSLRAPVYTRVFRTVGDGRGPACLATGRSKKRKGDSSKRQHPAGFSSNLSSDYIYLPAEIAHSLRAPVRSLFKQTNKDLFNKDSIDKDSIQRSLLYFICIIDMIYICCYCNALLLFGWQRDRCPAAGRSMFWGLLLLLNLNAFTSTTGGSIATARKNGHAVKTMPCMLAMVWIWYAVWVESNWPKKTVGRFPPFHCADCRVFLQMQPPQPPREILQSSLPHAKWQNQ